MAETSKQRLARAAFELFEERGFDRTTVDDIATRAGVGRTTFFRAFATKEDVIFPDHDTLLAAIGERFGAASPGAAPVAVTEAARLVLLHYLAEGDLARTRYRLTSTVPSLRAREIAGQRQYQRLFLRFVRSWMARTWTGDPARVALRAELMADAVVTAHNHVLRAWLRGDTETPESDFDEAMAEVLGLFGEPDSMTRAAGDGGSRTAVVVLRTARDLEDLVPELRRLVEEAPGG